MEINKKFPNGIKIQLTLDSGVYIISDDSATGKSYLFKLLSRYFMDSSIKYSIINYEDVDRVDFSDDYVVKQCEMNDIVALDNADLYMNPDLFKRLNTLDTIIIISIKDEFLMFPFHKQCDSGNYRYKFVDVIFENGEIGVL